MKDTPTIRRRLCWAIALVALWLAVPSAATAQDEGEEDEDTGIILLPPDPAPSEDEADTQSDDEADDDEADDDEADDDEADDDPTPSEHDAGTEPGDQPGDEADDQPGDEADDDTTPEIVILPPDEDADAGLETDDDEPRLSTIYVTHTKEEVAVAGGSAHILDEKELEALEQDDPNSVMLRFPGVYVRGEDGYGLRPNIGIRGASAERSKKVTLMEDGILLAPAPYAAPAAYYFPMMQRIVSVEVFKGPGSVIYGPNTIGGAVNLVTRDAPTEPDGEIDLAIGSFLTTKAHGHWGWSDENAGVLVEGVHLQSNGFKEIDVVGGDTGFSRSEVTAKAHFNTDPGALVYHRVDGKIGFAREHSFETYTGLSDEDFEDDPYRRYVATERGDMQWSRLWGNLGYRVEVGDALDVTTTLYRHDFTRIWEKLNGFADGPPLDEILADPESGQRAVFYDVLTGNTDTASSAEVLLVGTNARDFFSQGVQSILNHRYEVDLAGSPAPSDPPLEPVPDMLANNLQVGIRLHHDEIERDHTEQGFRMQDRSLVADGTDPVQTTRNDGRAVALAIHALDELSWQGLTVALGLRTELIWTGLEDELRETESDAFDWVIIPGLGLHYAITDELGVLAGVHRGFSPVAPGQPEEVDAETSINYEAGLRYTDTLDLGGGELRQALFEAIGFFNDYRNLTGQCTFSAGCSERQLDRQFNAGEVFVWGVEAVAQYAFGFSVADARVRLPLRATYTYTGSHFRTDFTSDNPQFGDVSEGDALPYVPEHQANASIGLQTGIWALHIGATYVGTMLESAGKRDDDEAVLTDDYVMLDALASIRPLERLQVYLKLDNITDTAPIISRRPFGARPARPFTAMGGVKIDL